MGQGIRDESQGSMSNEGMKRNHACRWMDGEAKTRSSFT